MSTPKNVGYVLNQKIVNDGKPKMTAVFVELFEDSFDSTRNFNSLEELHDNVGLVVSDMVKYIAEETNKLDLLRNFKVICNENNNKNLDNYPYTIELHYRHKDSTKPTIIRYTVSEKPPETVVDRYAAWKR